MNKTIFILLVLVGMIGYTINQQMPIKDQWLVIQYGIHNDSCRDRIIDIDTTQKECSKRDYLEKTLMSHGLCYGTRDQAEFEKTWQNCAVSY